MDERIARVIASDLLHQYGLGQWRVRIMHRKTQYGLCIFGEKVIELSSFHLKHSSNKAIMNTITHEVAHAIVGKGHGHDAVWVAKHKELGGDGERCASEDSIRNVTAKYKVMCNDGGHELGRVHRSNFKTIGRTCRQHGSTIRLELV